MKMAEGNAASRRNREQRRGRKKEQENPAEGLRKMKRLSADDAGNNQQSCRQSSTVLAES